MRRRSRAEALALVAEYEASGQSRREFCAGRSLAVATLDLYRKRARKNPATTRLVVVDLRPAFKPDVAAGAGSSPMTVVLGNRRRIEIGRSLDGALLLELIGVLERA